MASSTTNSMTPLDPPPSNDRIAAVFGDLLRLSAADAAAAAVAEQRLHPDDAAGSSLLEDMFFFTG